MIQLTQEYAKNEKWEGESMNWGGHAPAGFRDPAPRRPPCCAEPPPSPLSSRASADGQKPAIYRDTARSYTCLVLAIVLVASRNALAARAQPLLAAPGTCATARHGSTDTTGGRGAGLLEVTYPNQGAGK